MEKGNHFRGGFTVAELVISCAISSMVMAGRFIGMISMQKTFKASEFHVTKQADQMRYLDYLSLDLRGAVDVNISSSGVITLTIPDYYTVDPTNPAKVIPRTPTIANGVATYGTAAGRPTVRYSITNGTLNRVKTTTANGVTTVETKALCTDVQEFLITPSKSGQVVSTTTSFIPKYQWTTNTDSKYRTGTTTFTNTLLRNAQVTSTP